MTVEFHNSKNAVWNAIQEALWRSGLVVADVRTLDKKLMTYKQSQQGLPKVDLVISAYKPTHNLEQTLRVGGEKSAWAFIEEHLSQLPMPDSRDAVLEVMAERQWHMLYDRMIAFHVQHGVSVPLSSSEFLAGLGARYPERDGMYFLAGQAALYDRARAKSDEVRQLELIPRDEASAIQWIRQQLREKPRSFQDLQPEFMRAVGSWQRHEVPIELSAILEQNFLLFSGETEVPAQIHAYLSSNFKELRGRPKDDPELRAKAKDRWYVPDPKKTSDLEKLRERELLKEFEGYRTNKAKQIKVFRVEAMRAGFKAAYDKKEYAIIVEMAEKLPEAVLQEDDKLLMYYDVAVMRAGDRKGKTELF
jgi:hypothetical protein